MTATLATLRDRVEQILLDVSNAIFTTGLIDESIRQAVHDYSLAFPQELETVITLPADGREIALGSLTGLIEVMEVWWPYDSSASTETWPPNQVIGWRLWWDNAQPVLFLNSYGGTQPQEDEEVRIWYTALQTLQDLDSASATSIRLNHETIIANGAAAKAAMSRTADLIETASIDLYEVNLLGSWALIKDREYARALDSLRRQSARFGPRWPISQGAWKLDKWDI